MAYNLYLCVELKKIFKNEHHNIANAMIIQPNKDSIIYQIQPKNP